MYTSLCWLLPLKAHWQNAFPHVSFTFSLIGRIIRTVAAERVLIGQICSLFQQSRRLSSSWLDNGTEFCLTFFSFLWTPEIPFYGRNARLLQTYYQLPVGCERLCCFKNIWFYCLEGLDICFLSFLHVCVFSVQLGKYWVSSLYACNDWIWTTIWGESGSTLFVRFSDWFRSCIC